MKTSQSPSSRLSDDEFAELLTVYMPAIKQWLRKRYRGKDIDDILQNTLLCAWIGRESFIPNTTIHDWLTYIAKHQLLNWLRNEQRKRNHKEWRFEFDENIHATRITLEFFSIVEADLCKCLDILPTITQLLIRKHYIEGYTYAELAVVHRYTISSIKMKIARGVNEMKNYIRKEKKAFDINKPIQRKVFESREASSHKAPNLQKPYF